MSYSVERSHDAGAADDLPADRIRRRVTHRVIPFLLLLYLIAYLDRSNVGYAALGMSRDLGFSNAVLGLGAGLFFIGYFLLEVPGTILVESWSARRWFMRIMVSWGLAAAAVGFVHQRFAFYGLRLLLGACEAGFAPGLVVYLSHWFLPRDRGRAMALFLIGIPLSGVLGAPISGYLLGVNWLGLSGWRWVFLAEGLPAIVLGVATFYCLTDWPRDARWLAANDRRWLEEQLRAEDSTMPGERNIRQALAGLGRLIPRTLYRAPVVLLMATYFFGLTAHYGLTIWLPKLAKAALMASSVSVRHLPPAAADRLAAWLLVLPYLCALAAMIVTGLHSDRTGERRWHTVLPVWIGAAGLAGAIASGAHLVPAVACLCIATAGLSTFISGLWSLVSSHVRGREGAVAVGLINSTGNLGGFAGTYAMGLFSTASGRYTGGLIYFIASAVLAGVCCLFVSLEGLHRVGKLADVARA